QLGDRIAQDGTPWINLRVETIRTLADAVASFELVRERTTVLSRAQALALVERACDHAFREKQSYFEAIASRPGLHRAMQRSIDDLRNAGLRAEDLQSAAFESTEKASGLRLIFEEYEGLLRDGGFIDRTGVLSVATRMLKDGARPPYGPGSIWIIAGDTDLTSSEEAFLALVTGGNAFVLTVDDDAWRSSDAPIRIVRGVGEENEIRGVFRSILERPDGFDQCELVYSERNGYLPLSYELSAEYSVAATFAEGLSASYTRPGAAALGFLAWVGGAFEAAEIETLLRAGAVDPWRGEERGVSALAIARALRNARIGWGRQRYISRLEAWSAARRLLLKDTDLSDARRNAVERDLETSSAAIAFIEPLLTMTAGLAEGTMVKIESLAEATAFFVREKSAIRNEIDAMAERAIVRMLTELSSLPVAEVSRREASARLSDAVIELFVAASNPRPGHLHVVPVRLGGWSGRPFLFTVGLDDSRHPGGSGQDPVLLDAERDALNKVRGRNLPMMSDRPVRNAAEFHRFLSRACESAEKGGALTLSYSSHNLHEERERFPSSTLLEVARKIHGGHEVLYEDLLRDVATDRWSFVPKGSALSGSEWWLARVFEESGRGRLIRDIERSYPWLSDGWEAKAARGGNHLTRWDGVITPSAALDPRLSGTVVSASRLEKLAGCPYRYFLENVLRIQPIEEMDRDPSRWLSPADFGSLLHETLEIFMKETCARGEKPSPQNHAHRINRVADDAIERWVAEVPPPNRPSVERQRQELYEACEVFLRTEDLECSSITAKYFEVGFGKGSDVLPSFAIDLGGGQSLQLRGRIDRVDLDDLEPLWDVWDYKSGSRYKFAGGGRLRKGTRIQHAIYARAIEALLAAKGLEGRVRRSGYYFTSRKGDGHRIDILSERGELERVLTLLCDVVASGTFLHGPENECKFCDYRVICGDVKEAEEGSARKIEANPDADGVRAWLELQGIE
ncbi:MAG TPA: PD-(D/E)XK nuclease family protein, partial [Thermoanaerobaculia bacterium]|nr:PD-(D/E)XK nuclease family protein [Thermoanaerobaculia bacterium]